MYLEQPNPMSHSIRAAAPSVEVLDSSTISAATKMATISDTSLVSTPYHAEPFLLCSFLWDFLAQSGDWSLLPEIKIVFKSTGLNQCLYCFS